MAASRQFVRRMFGTGMSSGEGCEWRAFSRQRLAPSGAAAAASSSSFGIPTHIDSSYSCISIRIKTSNIRYVGIPSGVSGVAGGTRRPKISCIWICARARAWRPVLVPRAVSGVRPPAEARAVAAACASYLLIIHPSITRAAPVHHPGRGCASFHSVAVRLPAPAGRPPARRRPRLSAYSCPHAAHAGCLPHPESRPRSSWSSWRSGAG